MNRNDSSQGVWPLTELMRPGRLRGIPPRSCRTAIKGLRGPNPTWQLKRAYADAAEAEREATRSSLDAYECDNCGFWHVGGVKAPPT